MADLQKFIRQHFLENNWSRKCDLSKFSVTKLREIAETFSNLDIKSKSAVIFTFANSSTPLNKEGTELVEKVINMALADENSYIRSAATVLQCRSPLNCLCLDLSDTNHSFLTTLSTLLSSDTHETVSSKILPMSEYLGEKISDEALRFCTSSPKSIGIKGCCLNSSIGFTINEKTPSQRMKEVYLEKLQEECERRRVHVPIPGRSFGKSDVNEDTSNSGQNRRAPSFPRRTSVVRKTDLLEGKISMSMPTSAGSSARARLVAMHSKNPPVPPNSKPTDRNGHDPIEANVSVPRRPSLIGVVDSTSSSAASNPNMEGVSSAISTPAVTKRSSKIKLLDFSDLPAIGIEAKRIKKEQQEKAREEKRKQKEQEMEERRHAREEARRARSLAAQASNTLKKSSLSTTCHQQQQQSATLMSQPQHLQPIVQAQPQPISVQPPHLRTVAWGNVQQQQQQQQWMPFSVAQSGRDGNGSIQQNSRVIRDQEVTSGAEEDEEEDDDLEEDSSNAISADGTFALTAPRGFRGFTEILPSNAIAIRPQQGTTVLLQRTTPAAVGAGNQTVSQFIGQQSPANSLLQPRIRFVRSWTSTSQASAIHEGYSGEVVTAASGQRFVQIPDGLITLATTATAAAAAAAASQQQQQQSQQSPRQQQTVIIANPTAHIQAAPTGTSQPVVFRAPNITSISKTPQQQATTLFVSPSLSQVPAAQSLPVGTSPRLQPRLIQIRPRTPLSTTVPTTAAVRSNAIPVILPAGAAASPCAVGSQHTQPRIIVGKAGLRPVAPAPTVQNQQQGYTRIVPRPPYAPSGVATQKQILPQPVLTHPLTREGLNLTPTQVTSIQSLFQGANRLSRLDKATILSFISGNGVNPQPESGTAQRIRLSEYRERVIDKESGMPMEVAVDTFLLLDYATGRFESIKSYRTLPPDQLRALPVKPKAPSVVTTSAP